MPLGTLIAAGLTAAGGTQMLGSSPAPTAAPPVAPPAPIKPGFPPLIPSTVGGAPPGNVLGSGSTPRTVESRAESEDPEEKELGPLEKVNKFLGTEVGRLGSGLAVGAYTDYRRRRATEKQFKFLEKKGLTPWEIGGGSSGGLASASPSTLGTSPSATSGSDRKLKERGVKVTEKKQRVSELLAMEQFTLLTKNIEKVGIELKIQELEYNNYWQILGAKMGPDNLKMALALQMNGLDLEQILLQMDMTPAQENATRDTWRQVHNEGSIAYRNFAAFFGNIPMDAIKGTVNRLTDPRRGQALSFNPKK